MLPKTKYLLALLLPLMALSCGRVPGNAEPAGEELRMYPDYQGVVIPPNLAPINFRVMNPGRKFVAEMSTPEGKSIRITSRDGRVLIPEHAWRKLLRKGMGGELHIRVFAKGRGGWDILEADPIRIAEEEIDAWIAFRKILPANILWKGMGIYQRSLETFEEQAIMDNSLTICFNPGNCFILTDKIFSSQCRFIHLVFVCPFPGHFHSCICFCIINGVNELLTFSLHW